MSASRSRLALAVAVTAALAALLVASAGVLAALPALLAFVPLLAGRYVGADRLERLIAARAPSVDRAGSRRPVAPRAAHSVAAPRGSRLLALSLAKRPPPVIVLT